ncbi:short chain dehydrogenase/reductase family oxidoreductase [Alcanivorax sp. S71-1-4]|uniref:YciK family oxidoreductase n=1 Tax=Alcanivorax sp. S71-1-4 TaxID=1177159 RepID=UPI00169CC678|nr:YciK family oxidoreductase [Alcanivorax sp. S71-1-4]KAF0809792.1 short chain dehydrogenase/reductase family oxidoreductase [Alcanivorax sp. S71-1-4]
MTAIHPDLARLQQEALNYSCPAGSFKDRVVLVTGAGDGIGRAVSLALADAGATVILMGRTQDKLERVYDDILERGGPQPALVPVNLEVATPANFEELAAMLDREFGRLDGLLHNASILGDITPLDSYGYGTWDSVMQVNLNAPFYLTRAVLPLLRSAKDASVVFTSSSVGRRARAFWGAYAVSKFATEGLMQVMADELENTSAIRANSINPGATRTRMRALAYPGEDANTLRTPEQLVPAYLWLLGPASTGITGQAFNAQIR